MSIEFHELSEVELQGVDGGINWDMLITGICGVAVIALASNPVGLTATGLFMASYAITRGLTS